MFRQTKGAPNKRDIEQNPTELDDFVPVEIHLSHEQKTASLSIKSYWLFNVAYCNPHITG